MTIAHMLAIDDDSPLRQMLDDQGAIRIPWMHGRLEMKPSDVIEVEIVRVSEGTPPGSVVYVDIESFFSDKRYDCRGIPNAIRVIEAVHRTSHLVAAYGQPHRPFYTGRDPWWPWHWAVESRATALSTSVYFRGRTPGEDERAARRLLLFYIQYRADRPTIVFVNPWDKPTKKLVTVDRWRSHLAMIRELIPDAIVCWFGADPFWEEREVDTRTLKRYVETMA